jgi:hypothetical protein
MKKTLLATGVALSFCAAAISTASAQARITLVNLDTPGVGLNEATPAQPIGGNPGKTLGEQRVIAYQYAMDLWGALLKSDTEIRVTASFAPLECTPGRVVLGQAGAISRVQDSQLSPGGDPEFDYPVALANARAGLDFTPDSNHILTNFSSSIDLPACQALGGSGWYYGLTGNSPNAADKANFLNVIMHEIGHGLGVSGNSRLFFNVIPFRSFKSSWDGLAFSNKHGVSYNAFEDFDDDRMAEALVTPGNTVWTGARTNPTARLLADNREVLKVTAPAAATYDFVPGDFGGSNFAAFKQEIVLVKDVAAAGQPAGSLGCDGATGQAALANAADLKGKIALVDRGSCEFGRKALVAQNAGAVAVIIANNVPGDPAPPGPGADGAQVTIPVIAVSQQTGQALRGSAPVVAAGTEKDPNRFFGLDKNGRMRLYTPAAYASGSTFSHVDTDMTPNALMEPAETKSLRADINVDVALDMFEDLGWPTNRNGTAKLGGCDTTIPVYRDTFIPGANVIAQANLCKTSSGGNRSKQLRCMTDHLTELRRESLISALELAKARQCVARM